jgi:hypothetical protein
MKATELRIGNLVQDRHSEECGMIDIVVLGIIDTMENHSYEPIPLTEEWLLKFGFIRQGGRKMWVKDKLCIDLKELPNIRGEFIEGWYIGLKDLGNVLFHSFMKVNHVHQLQNLYFALTGEELTIKKIDHK